MSARVTVTSRAARESLKSFMELRKKGEEAPPPPSFELMNDTCERAIKQIIRKNNNFKKVS